MEYQKIETYRRREIRKDEDGFYWMNGRREEGYFDTVESCRDGINMHDAAERDFYRDMDTPSDTPCLDTSFHDYEMAV